jgi:CRP-like cAMP-binding protein
MNEMDLIEFQETVGEMQFIRGLPPSLQDLVAEMFFQVSSEESFDKGQVLYKKGEQGEGKGALLMKGAAEVDRGNGDLVPCQAPELFGEMMLLDEENLRTADVSFTEDSVIFQFKWSDLIDKALESFAVEQQLDLQNAITNYAGARFKEIERLGELGSGHR